ncbi:M48 family metallopeptidase [Acetobacter oryzoeni]|nr:YgjP-like metallopeptidase domain-containing protein [Acetobacter oryzoeni]MCP1202598.1 M48 family metallopeptidase [Acetobacter oryzoeni]
MNYKENSSWPDHVMLQGYGAAKIIWRISTKAKRCIIRISAKEQAVLVTLPKNFPHTQALAFLHKQAHWITTRLEKLVQTPRFTIGSKISIQDKDYLICHAPDRKGGAWLENECLFVSGDPSFLARRVENFLKQYATKVLAEEIHQMAQTVGLHPTRLDIRDTSSRWGSCSSSGRIMLSWRLVMAPFFVRHYLIAHELSHLQHMNHSLQFWKMVDRLTPHRQQAESWLRHFGAILQAVR